MALRSWFFLAWWLPLAIVAAEEQAEGCSAKTCSNLTISSPLWLADMETGRSCGVMDFEVYCNSSNTTILWSSEVYGFAILDIHYEEGSLHVVDLGKLNVLNNPGRSHVLNRNTSAELGQVNASNYQELIRDGFLLTWQPPSSTGTSSGSKRGKKKLLIALLFPYIYVLLWQIKWKRLWLLLRKKSSSSTERNYEAMLVTYGSLAPKRYMYSEVMKITSSRSDQLGRGGYGVVFKGRLHDGRLVAVKFLHDCKGNGDEFVNEVMSIGRTSHVNVVSLHGFCLEGSKRALIYEYMTNGSLDKYIYSENPKEILGWDRLYAIAIGVARGLEYLHHSCNTRIVHFDIKPQNILLDKDFSPKIADFGLAKLCKTTESKLSMTGARGTIGFIAPEVHSRTFGVVSTKSDVYSYGMMLEMVGGRRNVKSIVEKSSEKYFPDWIYDHLAQDDGLQAVQSHTKMRKSRER
ncbi:hypothetical protein ACQ4PT_047920 [Festuca glaucescens]